MWCMLREARNYIFLRPPGASSPAHQQQGRAGKATRCAARSELLPGSCGQVLVPVSRLTAVPAVMDEVLWVIHAPRSQGGASWAALAPNPASHHVSPSRRGLPKGCSRLPCLWEPSSGASPRVEQQIAASLPRL